MTPRQHAQAIIRKLHNLAEQGILTYAARENVIIEELEIHERESRQHEREQISQVGHA